MSETPTSRPAEQVVERCALCPFGRTEKGGLHVCARRKGWTVRGDEWIETPPPYFCPLREAPVLVRLRSPSVT